ncbi:MAG: glycosyl hydrolase family 65 protein, partial [Rhodospirillales bacterium]
VFGFAGLTLRDDGLEFDPHLPSEWSSLVFRIQWRGRKVKVRVEAKGLQATLEEGGPLDLYVASSAHRLEGDAPHTISIQR